MDVEAGVDATSHTTRSLYDGHGHPFSLFGVRDGTAVPDRSDGRFRLLVATRTNHPNSETGRAAVKVPLGGLGRRRFATSRDSKSDRTCQHSRNYSGPTIKRWTLREVSMYWGCVQEIGRHDNKEVDVVVT